MANVLYLVHRMPFPPNKGDKVRSYHLLRHLQQGHRVFLGTFLDDPQDEEHVDALRAMCPDLHLVHIDPSWRKVRSLTGLLDASALSVAFYRQPSLHRWIAAMHREHHIDASVVFSGAMAQFAMPLLPEVPMLVDFVDVDSIKWGQYVAGHRWPLSWLYQREADCLRRYETHVAGQARRSFFVTAQEAALFKAMVPAQANRVDAICNGVDATTFQPDQALPSPFAVNERALVFTGAMDYWPNIDAVQWCVQETLPLLAAEFPDLIFYIVGRNPSAAVKALAGPRVVVTGTVPDVRPYLQHASAVVAPLRVARGIQNKILEAMAMAQPVVTVPGCAEVIGATPAEGVLPAHTSQDMHEQIRMLLRDPDRKASLGLAARAHVLRHFSWQAHLSALDRWLSPVASQGRSA